MKKRLWIIVLAAIAMLAGCQRRPLENIYSTTVRVIVKCLWTVEAYPEGIKPSGVTMYFFRDGEYYTTITTANVDSCTVNLPEGHYKMYMITQSPEEYWKMQFDHMTDFHNASTTLRPTVATWATRGTTEEVVENPEVICAGVSDEFEITTQMAEDYQYYYSYLKKMMAASGKTKTKAVVSEEEITYYEERVEYYTIRIPVYPKNIVSQMWVSIYAKNADVLKSVRASNSGMARTFELTQDVTGSEEAIQIIDKWNLIMDDEANRIGHVDGLITTFGLPNGETPSAKRDSTLNVSALLIDNATVADYVFNTGNKIKLVEPNPGYRSMYRLIIGSAENPAMDLPDVKPPGGKTSGMDATVADWEEGETVEIPM